MKPMRLFKIVIAAVALATSAVLLWSASGSDCRMVVSGASGVLQFDSASLPAGQAQSYCYTDDAGRKLRFILARGSDGQVRSVFDACRQCYVYHRGFRVAAGELICRVCGNHYPIDHMMTGKASCVPENLPHQEFGQSVRIKISDLKSGRALF